MTTPASLRFRQVHLDFHTSPAIPGIGEAFDAEQFKEALRVGHVNSITVFSKCHHGWSYHPTCVGRQHPHLTFDLLDAQIKACDEIGVNHPIYLSAGLDNVMALEHPEWRRITPEGGYGGWTRSPLEPGFNMMCFNSPYLEYLCEQIREMVTRYPNSHGIFLDIINQGVCCCKYCMEWMAQQGLDARTPEAREKAAAHTIRRYYEETTRAATSVNPKMPVFHNSGHIPVNPQDILPFFSHLELESLPTGGWGYDHYPMSAKYVTSLGLDRLGMTGKFHTAWGEFGGFKHPNALRYECAAMLAFGSKCSVGDQLHPSGKMDASTYALIGSAYAEVEQKEPWCQDAENVADVALLLAASMPNQAQINPTQGDIGANRVLLEGHFLYDIIDYQADFNRYRMLVIADDAVIPSVVQEKLQAYVNQGGRLFLCGRAGLNESRDSFCFDVGAQTEGPSPYAPDYLLPRADFRADFLTTPCVAYLGSQRVTVTDGESLGEVYDPYFNRTYEHFCSHQHTPNQPSASGFACGVKKGNILYLAHNVFTLYHAYGAVAIREYIVKAMRYLLGSAQVEVQGLPSTGRLTLTSQSQENRLVLHLLYANTILRGAAIQGSKPIEIIEDLTPVHNIQVTLRLAQPVRSARLVPENQPVELQTQADGSVQLTLPTLLCHQMLELSL